jgi:hypothetical protein
VSTFEDNADRLSIITSCGGQSVTVLSAPYGTSSYNVEPYNGEFTFLGILDRGYVEVGQVECERPLLVCRTSDVSSVAHDDSLTTGGVSYLVKGIQPDGTGITTLVLEET